jgi:hypothetical protein
VPREENSRLYLSVHCPQIRVISQNRSFHESIPEQGSGNFYLGVPGNYYLGVNKNKHNGDWMAILYRYAYPVKGQLGYVVTMSPLFTKFDPKMGLRADDNRIYKSTDRRPVSGVGAID